MHHYVKLLVRALETNKSDWANYLISLIQEHKGDINLNVTNEQGTPLLSTAICKQQNAVARFLLDAGANSNAPDKDHTTPLMHAAANNNTEMLQLLIEKGCDCHQIVPSTDGLHWSAIDLAVRNKHIDSIKILIRENTVIANPRAFEEFLLGRNPNEDFTKFCLGIYRCQRHQTKGLIDLFLQIEKRDEWPVDLLIAMLYDKNQDIENAIPHVILAAEYHTHSLKWGTQQLIYLVQKFIETSAANKAIEDNTTHQALTLILSKLPNANHFYQDIPAPMDEKIESRYNETALSTYQTLLLKAVKASKTAWVNYLIPLIQNCQESLDVRNANGNTLLHMAITTDQDDIARRLIHAGVNLDINDLHYLRPLHHAAIMGKTEIVKLLIEKGATCDNGYAPLGQGPLQLALLNIHTGVVNLLVREHVPIHNRDDFEKYLFSRNPKHDSTKLCFAIFLQQAVPFKENPLVEESKTSYGQIQDAVQWHSISFFLWLASYYRFKEDFDTMASSLKEGVKHPVNLSKRSTRNFLTFSLDVLETYRDQLTMTAHQTIWFAIFKILTTNNLNEARFLTPMQWDRIATEAMGADYFLERPAEAAHFALKATEMAEKTLRSKELQENTTEYEEIKKAINASFSSASRATFFSKLKSDNPQESYHQLLPSLEKESAELIQAFLGSTEVETESIVNLTFKAKNC